MARSVSSISSNDNDKTRKGVLDIRLLEYSMPLQPSTIEGTGDTPQEGRTSSGECPLTTIMSSQEMPPTDSTAAIMKSRVEIIRKHNIPPPPENIDEYEEEAYPVYPPETRTRVMQWLDGMPSSPSSVTSDADCSSSRILTKPIASQDSIGSVSVVKTPSSIQRRHSKTVREKVIDNEPLTFSSAPAPLRSCQERSAILDAAEAHFQEWERNKILDKQGYVKPVVVKGVAKWYKSTKQKSKTDQKRSWLSPRRFIMWLTGLGMFQWFVKKKTDDTESKHSIVESYHDDLNNNHENSSPEDTKPIVTFVPYRELSTLSGKELSPACAFGGEPIQDQIESAVATIVAKTRPTSSTDHQSKLSKPCVGCSDAEATVLNPDPEPVDSTEELKRLTELLSTRTQSSSKPNSPKMHSIFAVRKEHVQSTSLAGADIEEELRNGAGGAHRNGFQYLLSRIRRRWQRSSRHFDDNVIPGISNVHQLRVTFHRRNRRIHPYVILPEEANLLHNNNYPIIGHPVHPVNQQEPPEEQTLRTLVSRVAQGFMRLFGIRSQEESPDQNLVLPGEEIIRDADAPPFQIFDNPRNNENSLNNSINLNLDLMNQEVLREQIMASQREFITRSPRRPGLLREEFPEGYPQPPTSTHQVRNPCESSPKTDTNKKSKPSIS